MYIEQGYKGLKDSWRYLVGLVFIFIGWQAIGMIPLFIAIISKTLSGAPPPSNVSEMATSFGANLFLLLMLLSFAIGLIFIFFTVKLLHKRTITALTTSRKKIDWKRVFCAFFIWAFITIIMLGVDIYFSPEHYEWNFNVQPFLILLVISVALIPLQTSFEEYLFRGYLMQGIGLASRNRWVPLIFTSIVFGLMHILNPEVEKLGYGIMVYYIGTGFFLGVLALMDEGLELSLGFHASNNLITALVVTADWTAFQTDSLYKDVSEPTLGWDVLIPVLVIYPILLYIFAKMYNWTNWKEKLTGKVLTEDEFLIKDME